MPIDFRIDSERRIVYVEVAGELTVDEVAGYRRRLQSDPAYSDRYDRLVDARQAAQLFAPADIRRLADLIRQGDHGSAPSKRAVVLSDMGIVMIMQVFQAYTRGIPGEYRIFSSVADAERWIADGDLHAPLPAVPDPAPPGVHPGTPGSDPGDARRGSLPDDRSAPGERDFGDPRQSDARDAAGRPRDAGEATAPQQYHRRASDRRRARPDD
jgi:hypothetical protein